MQGIRFDRFPFSHSFSGNAEALLLPFPVLTLFFGQCTLETTFFDYYSKYLL